MSWNNRNYNIRFNHGYRNKLQSYGHPPRTNGNWENGWISQQMTVWENPTYRMTSRISVGVHGDYNRKSVFSRLNFGSGYNVYSQQVAYELEYPYQSDPHNPWSAPNHAIDCREFDFTQDWDFENNRSYNNFGNHLQPREGCAQSANSRAKAPIRWQRKRKQTYRKDNNPQCYECGQTFDSFKAMFAHKDSAHNKNCECRICGKVFRSRGLLKKHEATHSIHPCPECPETFGDGKTLSAHMAKDHGKGPQVRSAPEQTGSETQTQTSPAEESERFTSPVASSTPAASFIEKSFKETSVQTIDSGNSVKTEEFACPYCIKKFGNEGLLESHVKIHTEAANCDNCEPGLFQCLYCIKTCTSEGALVSHMTIHTEVVTSEASTESEPSLAYPCGVAFDSQDTLKLKPHSKTHPDAATAPEKPKDPKAAPIFCPFCSQAFYARRELALHMTSKHTEVHYCSECAAEYSTEAELNAHRKVHYGAGQW